LAHAIFISYRRDDSEGEAGRLYDDLARAFGNDAIFMDVSGIDPGMDFRKAIDANVGGCHVLLAMIGPTWATIAGTDGQRRLDNDNDYVRLEIASGLARNIAVIPVLVHDAKMPHVDQLPDNLKDMAYRNSVEITHARWDSDVQLLVQALAHYVHPDAATETETVHATIPAQLPPLRGQAETLPAKSKRPLWIGIGITALVLILAAGYLALRGSWSASISGSVKDANGATTTAGGMTTVSRGPAVAGQPLGVQANLLAGRWANPEANAKGALTQLDITGTNGQLTMHAWALCHPANCDWGTQTAQFDGQKARATWSLLNEADGDERGRVATVTVSPGGVGKLTVQVENTYAKHKGNVRQFEFVPAS